MGLSVAIACKNNEQTIGRTLESVRGLADEIVAADSGSTDGTMDLLASHDARVIETEWKGHVATKQLAIDACSHDWVLLLDSDESLEPELRDSVARVIERGDDGLVACEMNRRVWYLGEPLRHVWQPEWRLRLFRKGRARVGGLDPHDRMELTGGGRVDRIGGILRHDSFGSIGEHFRAQADHARSMAASLHRAGKRGSYARLLTSPVGAFTKQMVIKGGWRDGWRGWVASSSSAAGTLMKHAVLIELGRAEREGRAT